MKRVFVLGAGASYVDGIPTQGDLLELMLSSSAADSIRVDQDVFRDQQTKIREFLCRMYGAENDKTMSQIPLEDILTVIDQGQRRMETLQGYSYRRLDGFRRAFIFCLTACLDTAQYRNREQKTCTDRFAEALVEEVVREKESNTVISLNWDTAFERATIRSRPGKVWIGDYCTYTHHWSRDDRDLENVTPDVSHITKRPNGLETLKILKLHGSLNWLYCPACDRLFTHADRNIARFGAYPPNLDKRRKCISCRRREAFVEPLIVTPTLMKNLGQTHSRMIWHNAHIELSEADEVVFIGYSFPLADFEFRYLITRALGSVKDRPRIRVVLFRSEDPSVEERVRCSEEERRYRSFFGPKVTVSFLGFEHYVNSEWPQEASRD